MTAPVNRTAIVKQLEPGLNAIFGMEYKGYEDEHKYIFDVETSSRAFEEEVLMTGFGAAPTKAEGAAVTYDSARESWVSRYHHETVALAFAFTEEAMEDNLYEPLAKRLTKALARSMAHTKQVKAAAVLNNGFSASYLGGDGVALFSTVHPLVDNSTSSNKAATDADLAEASLEQALIDISLFVDDRNIPSALQAKHILIPPQLAFVAERLLASSLRVATSDNDVNAIKSRGMLPGGYHVIRRLTDTDAWFVKTDAMDGLKMFQRIKLATKIEGDFETGNTRYKARERYSFGWSDWRSAWGTSGA